MANKTPQVRIYTPATLPSNSTTDITSQKGDTVTPKKDTVKKDATKKDVYKNDTQKTAAKHDDPVTPTKTTKKVSTAEKGEPTPKKKKEPVKYTELDKDQGAVVPVNVTFLGESTQAMVSDEVMMCTTLECSLTQSQVTKQGTFSHTIKVNATATFSLHKSVCPQCHIDAVG